MDEKIIIVMTVALLTIHAGYHSEKARKKTMELLNNKRWLVNMGAIVVFTIYLYYSLNDRVKLSAEELKNRERLIEAYKRGLVALLIAILAEVGLTIAPFWIIFTLSYYMQGWV